jgi:hypothetical protein
MPPPLLVLFCLQYIFNVDLEANLSMLEKKDLLPLVLLHRNNNVKVQSVASEVIDSLVELRMKDHCDNAQLTAMLKLMGLLQWNQPRYTDFVLSLIYTNATMLMQKFLFWSCNLWHI